MQINVVFGKDLENRLTAAIISIDRDVREMDIDLAKIFTPEILAHYRIGQDNKEIAVSRQSHTFTIKVMFSMHQIPEMESTVEEYITKIKHILNDYERFKEIVLPEDYSVSLDLI